METQRGFTLIELMVVRRAILQYNLFDIFHIDRARY
jgi:competence protein ComGC